MLFICHMTTHPDKQLLDKRLGVISGKTLPHSGPECLVCLDGCGNEFSMAFSLVTMAVL